MAERNFNGQLEAFLESEGHKWVMMQRQRHRPRGRRLRPKEIDALSAYFDAAMLDDIRVALVDRIDNPPFFRHLQEQGFDIPFDFRFAAGITFVDTVVTAAALMPDADLVSLLFHEAVHVAQYRIMGLEAFVSEYIRGWAQNGYDYYRIPLEQQAFSLQNRFESQGKAFCVASEIRKQFK